MPKFSEKKNQKKKAEEKQKIEKKMLERQGKRAINREKERGRRKRKRSHCSVFFSHFFVGVRYFFAISHSGEIPSFLSFLLLEAKQKENINSKKKF